MSKHNASSGRGIELGLPHSKEDHRRSSLGDETLVGLKLPINIKQKSP